MPPNIPDTISDVRQLEQLLSEPTDAAIRALEQSPGDVLLLGVAGKMGPTLARMVRRADEISGTDRRVLGVSRFSLPGSEAALEEDGIETIRGDLLDETFLRDLPDAPNVIYMVGMKFGSTQDGSMTWAMNVHLPSLVCRRFRSSRIVAFSTGNVYPLVPIESGGSKETDRTGPVGEYAMTALGRERMFEYFSRRLDIPIALIRLNYAVEMRYGVLVDVGNRVWTGQPVDVTMGYANVIWQADANAMTLAALVDVAVPPFVINVAGPEQISIRETADRFGRQMNKPVQITSREAETAILSDGASGHRCYGSPRVDVDTIIRWTADWIMRGGAALDKPTHFEVRDGKF